MIYNRRGDDRGYEPPVDDGLDALARKGAAEADARDVDIRARLVALGFVDDEADYLVRAAGILVDAKGRLYDGELDDGQRLLPGSPAATRRLGYGRRTGALAPAPAAPTPRVVVTRHEALVEYLVEAGIVDPGTPVIPHATEDHVRGRHVIGVLPLRLAALAESVTEIPLSLPPEARGRELSLDEVRRYAGLPATYVVRRSREG